MSPKREAEISHRIAALSFSLIHALNEIEANSQTALELKDISEKMQKKCEQILEECFQVKQVSSTNYLVDLSNKIDTVVRKNYQRITELK